MNRKILTCIIALSGALAAVAQALEAPAAAGAAAAGTSPPNPQLLTPPALRMPEADPATVKLVWQAVVDRFPEIVDGPERNGRFVVAIALRPDGRVVRSGMRYLEQRSDADLVSSQQAVRDLLPSDVRSLPGMGLRNQQKGAAVLGGRILKGEVLLNASMVPTNWDETRDSGIVRRAVLQKHADLFLPMSGDHINQLIVVMDENGAIAREKMETVTVEHQGTMTSMKGGCRLPPIPGTLAESGVSADQAAAGFATLGLGLDQMGTVGTLSLNQPRSEPLPRASVPAVGADGIARGAMPVFDQQMLRVCYAWPRRPGEPIGGTALAWESIPQQNKPPSQFTQVSQLVDRYFPSGSPANGNWMLLTFNGEVVRTGHVELGKDEQLTNRYVERMLPGIRVGGSMGTGHAVTPKNPGEMPLEMINVSVYFLTPDSPLPPAEDVLLPAK